MSLLSPKLTFSNGEFRAATMQRFLILDLVDLATGYIDPDQVKQLRLKLDPKRVRISETAWPFGGVWTRRTYLDGEQRMVEEYHPNGNRKLAAGRKGQSWHGKYRSWNKDGTPAYRGNYYEGERHGLQIEWYESGSIKSWDRREHGWPRGKRYEWWPNGNKQSFSNYRDGRMCEATGYNEDGSLTDEEN